MAITRVSQQAVENQQLGGAYVSVWPGIQGPDVITAVERIELVVQERPQAVHPPFVQAGVPGPNAAPPSITNVATTRQESPDHAAGAAFAFAAPPLTGIGPAVRTAITRQEPVSVLSAVTTTGVQGPNVAPPVVNRAITRQEDVVAPPPVGKAGIQGPNVAPPVRNVALTRQEDAVAPPPRITSPIQGPNVAPAVRSIVITAQESPDLGRATTLAPLPVISPRTGGTITITLAEQPDQPRGQARTARQGPDVGTAFRHPVLTTQEQPWHPNPSARQAPFPPVAPPVAQIAITRQEQPWQPPQPLFQTPIQPLEMAGTRSAITRQEQPDEPSHSRLSTPLIPPTYVPATIRTIVITVAEQPSEWFWPSVMPPGVPAVFQRYGTMAADLRDAALPIDLRTANLPGDVRTIPLPIDL